MSLESDVASVLRNDPVGRISFRVDTIAVSKAQMESVAKAIFDAAIALVDGHKMLAKPGVALTWKDCDALRDAIKAHPAYRG